MKSATPRKPDRCFLPAVGPGALFLATALAAADSSAWQHRQTLAIDAPGIVHVALPDETLDAARADHGDIRIVDAAGREIAFALVTGRRPAVRPVAARAFRSTLSATATQLVIDAGAAAATEVVLETPAPEFVKRARLESSADGTIWQSADDGLPLFRQAGVSRLSVPAPARHLRITIDDARSRPVPFTGARIIPAAPTAAPTQPLAARIARREEFAGETVLTLDLSAAHVPLDTLTLTTPERLFTRRVTVGVRELRDEAAVERTVAAGTIFTLLPDGEAPTAHTSLALDAIAPSRELIVHIANDDSPPLAISAVALTRLETTLTFDAPAAGEYALLTGQPQAVAPRYDVARLRPGHAPTATRLTPGPLTANPDYRAPEALAGTLLLGAALDPAPWLYRKAVRLAAAGVHQLELDLDVLAHAQSGFGDVRLLRDGAQVPYLIERPALARALELALTATNDPRRPRISRWEIKLPRAGLPLTRLTLTSPTALFQRQLHVFEHLTDDRGNRHTRSLAIMPWSRTPGAQRALIIPLPAPPTTDTLIIETDNGDNPPLVLATASATHPVTRLLFKADPAPLALYYGHPQAPAPRYDLALVAAPILAAEKHVAALAAEERTKAGSWTKTALGAGRGGILFWSVLALVVVVLLIVVAKLLPKPPAAPS